MSIRKSELIDTLWNVNMKLLLVLLAVKQELIDTLWNVNAYKSRWCVVASKRN